MLTAIATPKATAVALPEPPFAIANDSAPAIAKMSEPSVALTRALLEVSEGQGLTAAGSSSSSVVAKVTVVSSSRARVVPVIELIETEPASESANEPLLESLSPPAATAPPPPAASVQMSPIVSAVTESRFSGVSTTICSRSKSRTVIVALRTQASVVALTPL